jgi:hypothetical protein
MASSQSPQLHFLLIPLMSQGHLIPMIDIAKMLAQNNGIVTIITTPLNAIRFSDTIDRAVKSGLSIRILQLHLPCAEAGLPEGCENQDSLPSPSLMKNFMTAMSMLQQPLEHLLEDQLKPSPRCIISDKNLAWTADTALKFRLPRILFDGTNCFNLLCTHNLHKSKVYETVSSSELFVVPGLPDRIEFARAQLPRAFNPGSNLQDMKVIREKIREAEAGAFGVLVNSYEELEPAYVQEYRKTIGGKIWCIGPVSLCNKDNSDRSERDKYLRYHYSVTKTIPQKRSRDQVISP